MTDTTEHRTSHALNLLNRFHCLHGKAVELDGYHRNNAIHGMVMHLIRYGVVFEADDFIELSRRKNRDNADRYLMEYSPGEHHYAVACGSEDGLENLSAARAFEKWKGRKPFLLGSKPSRVYKGARFIWRGGAVFQCTSFAEDQSHFVARRHKFKPRIGSSFGLLSGDTGVLGEEIAITHDMLREFHAELKTASLARREEMGKSV